MVVHKKAGDLPAKTYADPFSAFRGEMDRMFENFLTTPGFLPEPDGLRSTWPEEAMVVPSMDIKESDKAIVLTAELPGLDEKDVTLTIADGVLVLKGEKKYEHEDEKEDLHVMERRYGSFMRRFRLPDTVDQDKVDAGFDKGVLTVTMGKKPGMETQERKIEIKR